MSAVLEYLNSQAGRQLIGYAVVVSIVFMGLQIMAAVMVYAERKVAAFMQQRFGPYRVGPRGVLQPVSANRHAASTGASANAAAPLASDSAAYSSPRYRTSGPAMVYTATTAAPIISAASLDRRTYRQTASAATQVVM